MRIIWFTWKDREHPLAGGAEVVSHKLAEKLVADGHTVEFIVGGFKGCAKTVTKNGFKITRLGNRYTVYVLAMLYYFKNLRKKNYDIIIDEVNTAPFFASWYIRNANIKHYLFFHQLAREIWFYQMPWFIGWIGYIAEAIYLRLLAFGDSKIITISNSTKNDLKRFGFKDSKINIISEGLDDDGANIKPLQSLAGVKKYDKLTILSFGAVRKMKRTLEIVKSFEILKKKKKDNIRLIIAGDIKDTYARKVVNYVKKSAFKKDIKILGRVTSEKKKGLMRRSHLIAVTSLKEGWGLIVTEANSQGTPAVVYDVDGLRDSVKNNETGLICAKNTPENMAKNIIKLLQDKKKYDKLRLNAWEWSKKITFDQSYEDLKKILDLK